jgi:mRNA interferase RelE/StbE
MSGEGRWTVRYAARGEKDIARLDPPLRKRVLAALGNLAENHNDGSLRKLKGRPESRLRVGEWRVLLELDQPGRTIIVKRVLPRGRAYGR